MPDLVLPFYDYFEPLGAEPDAPYPTVQMDFWDSKALSPALIGAARCGKTMTGAGKTFATVIEQLELGSVCNALVVGPRWDEVRAVLVEEFLKIVPRDLVSLTSDGKIFHETRKEIRLLDLAALARGKKVPGPIIWFRSGEDPKALYGYTCGVVLMDEAGQMVEECLVACSSRLSQNPSRLFATFTPYGGTQHWANKKWALGAQFPVIGEAGRWEGVEHRGTRIANPDPESPAWHMIYTDNYTLPEAWRRQQEINIGVDTPRGRQQLLGQVVDFGGTVFGDYFDTKIHVKQMPEEFKRVAGGLDRAALGGTTAIKVVGLQPSGRLYSCFEWGKKHASLEDIASVCAELQHRYPGIVFHCDPHPQGEWEIGTLRAHGIRISRAAKKDMLDFGVRLIWRYMRVQGDGLPGYHISPANPRTIVQYQTWGFIEGKAGGEVTYDVVQRGPKDFIDAERYAIVGLLTAGAGQRREIDWRGADGKSAYPARELVGVR
jgi:hypothetical protein